MNKSIFSAVGVAAVFALSMAAGAEAQTWKAGENATATLKSGTLTIKGKGVMFWDDYCGEGDCPETPYGADVKNVVIEDGITVIGHNAFSGWHWLKSVTIGNSVTGIEHEAFSGCTGLTSIRIGNGVGGNDVGGLYGIVTSFSFSDYPSLTKIEVGNDNTVFSSIDGVLFNKAQDILLIYPRGKQGTYSIPNSVTSIGGAFQGCTGLTSVTIPNSVTSISGAFQGCTGLTSVTIPNSVTEIGRDAFSGCTGLKSVMIPNSVIVIGEGAFSGCTSLTSVTIPNSVIYLSGFSGCTGLTSVMIPNSVTSIKVNAFSECTSLTSVTIPNNVTSIDGGVFSGCTGLKSLTISNRVTFIGAGAFSECTSLTSVTIPNSVTEISGAFQGCTGLTSVITLNPTSPPKLELGFYGIDMAKVCLYVPSGSIDAYRSADGWKEFSCIKDVASR